MEIVFIVLLTWGVCAVLSAGIMQGWTYYYLYPQYPRLGTPEELWNKHGAEWAAWTVSCVGGPLTLVMAALVLGKQSGWRLKW